MAAETENTMNERYRIEVWGEAGQAGATAELYLDMYNYTEIAMWNCTLQLPEGVTFVSVEPATGEEGRYPDAYNPVISTTVNDAGNVVTFSCSGAQGIALTGNTGVVAVVTVNIASTVEAGQYNLIVSNITLEGPSSDIHNYSGTKEYEWTVEPAAVVEPVTITFETGFDDVIVEPISAVPGEAVTAPADPEKAGYTFMGWEPAVPEVMPEQDMTCVAQWSINQYTITFVTGFDDVVVDPITQDYNTPVQAPENPTKEGYVFIGWEPSVPEVMPAEDTECVAQWEATVEFFAPTEQYTMFSSDKDLDFTDSPVKAYIAVDYIEAVNYAMLEPVTVVPAGTGVMLVAEVPAQGEPYMIPFFADEETPAVEGNLFVAVLEAAVIAPSDPTNTSANYVLNPDEANAFSAVTGDGVQLPAKSAYLQLNPEEVGDAATVRFGLIDNTTAITSVKVNDGKSAIFDLQGRRVSQPAKGLYIINGKKVAVK
ncbi:MAG: InlB B-repeat-containing protein [Bacteroidaceae bacterium]|nr:InlB B-repeat-containing protein [Bacteroidaceae bacterium]